MTLSAVVVCLLCSASSGQSRAQVVEIQNHGTTSLVEHTIMVTLEVERVQAVGSSSDFDSVRFYDGLDSTTPISFWKMSEQPGVSATYWIRIPQLPPGSSYITFRCDQSDGTTYQPTTMTARLRAVDGVRLALRTDPPDKATTHPTVVVAEGWMTRLSPDVPPTVNRVLVDTMFPQDPSPFATANELENPELWLSSDGGLTWDWPPDVSVNPSWQFKNNWITGTPPDGNNNSDPDAIFLEAGSLPSGGPTTDTLRVYHRTNGSGHAVVFDDLTSADGAWSGVRISAFNATNLKGIPRGFTSPAVIQEADGSLRMWASNLVGTNTLVMMMYESQDGVTWSTAGTVDIGVPKNLWGPWHFDVIKEDGAYWMLGSFGAFQDGVCNMRDLFMLRSEDGLKFSLLLPTVLEPATGGWFRPGSYRPSMVYVPGDGLEVYVGCNDRNTSQAGDGGTGRWLDPGWAPHRPRPVSAISTVFWGSARDFAGEPTEWPHPWYPVDDNLNATTLLQSGGVMAFMAESTAIPRAKMDSVFQRPRDHEYYARVKVEAGSDTSSQAASSHGVWVLAGNGGTPPQGGVQYRWGSSTAPVAGPVPIGDLSVFHDLKFRRVGSLGRCWWDGVELSAEPFSVAGSELADDLAWQAVRRSADAAAMYVDWYFYRDAADPEPVILLPCDDLDPCTVDSYDPQLGCVFVTDTCDDQDACTIDSCDPQFGCIHAMVSCDDGDPATPDSCVSPIGLCIHGTVPAVLSSVSVKTHGAAGVFAVDVSDGAAVEPRIGGPTTLIVTFDRPVTSIGGSDASLVTLSSGVVDSVLVAGDSATIHLSGVSDAANVSMSFPGVVNAVDGAPVTSVLCFTTLAGDVNKDRKVNVLDLITVRNVMNQPLTATNFRCDVSSDGALNVLDLILVRNRVNLSAPNPCP